MLVKRHNIFSTLIDHTVLPMLTVISERYFHLPSCAQNTLVVPHLMDSRPPVTSLSMIFKHGTQATISSAFGEDCSLAFCKVDDDKIMLGMQQWGPQSASVHKRPSTAARRRNEGSSLLVCHGPPPAVVSPLPSCSSPQITCNFTRRHLSFQWLPTVTFELIWRCSCYQKGGS